jgi:hypothetical protein
MYDIILYITLIIIFIIILLIQPEIPYRIRYLFNLPLFRFLFICLILYTRLYYDKFSIILLLYFIIIIHLINKQFTKKIIIKI